MNRAPSCKPLRLFLCLVVLLVISACRTPSSGGAIQEEAPWRTLDLQALIDDTPDGAEVFIPYGRYRLEKGLLVKGRKHLTITARTGTWIYVEDLDAHVITIAGSEDIEVRNLSLRHWEPLEVYECHGSVVEVQDSTSIRILNSVLDGCGAVGVSAEKSRDLFVAHCQIQNNSFNAFYFYEVNTISLRSNVIEDNANFMQAYHVHQLEMRENEIRNNFGYWARRSAQAPGTMEDHPAPAANKPNEDITAADRYRIRGEYKDLKEVVDTRFVKGKTTREDVRLLLGKGGDNGAEAGGQPGANYVYPGVGKHLWVYFSRRKEPYGSILLVEFDQHDRVSDFFWVSE